MPIAEYSESTLGEALTRAALGDVAKLRTIVDRLEQRISGELVRLCFS